MELLITIFFIISVLAAFLFTLFGGFGNLLILLFSLLYSLLTGFKIIEPRVFLALALIYLTGELFEYLFIMLGVRFSGAGKRAAWGAIIGGLLAAALSLAFLGAGFMLFVVLGIFFGAFLVELQEKKDILKAFRAGIGSFLGRFGAVIFKLILGILMLFIIAGHIVGHLTSI
jgi:uncharacterized protein